MSSEVCPSCGKTFKRLKSHLPHCKAANSQTNPTGSHVGASQTPSSPPLGAGDREPTVKGKKSRESPSVAASPRAKKSTTSSAAQTPDSTDSSSSSPPPSTKKKREKLSEQIKLASMPSSTTSSLISSPTLPPPSTASRPKKKSLRAQIEAANTGRASKGSLEGTGSASEDLLSGSTPVLTDPLISRSFNPPEPNVKTDGITVSALSTDTKPKEASKKKTSKTKRAEQSPPTTRDPDSDSLDSGFSNRPHVRDDLWVDNLLTSGSGDQARITIQDAKALLGRTKTSTTSKKRILSETETTDHLSSNNRLDTGLRAVTVPAETGKDVARCLVTTQTVSEQLLGASSQQTELLPVKERSSKSKETFLIPLELDGSSQPKLFFPESPLSQTSPPPGSVGALRGQKVARDKLLSLPLSTIQFSSPRLLPARVETVRAADWRIPEDRKQNAAQTGKEEAGTRPSLGQVKLRDLPQWLGRRVPSRPRDAVEIVQRGWQWYYRRYINVKKGGVGGVGMLLAGYCVLSYIWSYPHIKRDRWRKYH
ncbi:polycystic kidney disease protein 1-like 3 [Pleuronectes platessa]|uniref:polycystic kidney disease protein 1-like 3 n=1 Tax=Pleuronectes platessa TaxID=8262 RepID=UPI00232A7257|nr:polycystic kidney disease protein 1-like 3 [Pleuronectes platessa]